jgi:hypothetical protein
VWFGHFGNGGVVLKLGGQVVGGLRDDRLSIRQ